MLFTQVPNDLFDEYLPYLSLRELKVLLVILRQTVGYLDAHGNRKRSDWISRNSFTTKTGLSKKHITKAIQSLYERGLIIVTDHRHKPLPDPSDRKGKKRLLYRCTLVTSDERTLISNSHDMNKRTSLLRTKETPRKKLTNELRTKHISTYLTKKK